MKAFFLPIGKAAERTLSTVFFALTGGLAQPVGSLDVLFLTRNAGDPASETPSLSPYAALCGDLNLCHDAFVFPDAAPLFASSFTFSDAAVSLPSREKLVSHPSARLLLDALRGPGAQLSWAADREAVEWAFSALLAAREEQETAPYQAWKTRISSATETEEARVTLLCDLCDPFSAGLAMACLRDLRNAFDGKPFFLSLLCFAGNIGQPRESSRGMLQSALQALQDTQLLRRSSGEPTAGADALWLLSLPASLVESEDSWRLTDLAAARVLARISSVSQSPSPGLHTLTVPSSLTLQSLGEQAASAVAMIRTAVWLLGDLFPSLQHYLAHPTLLRSLAPSSRSALFKRLMQTSQDIHGWDSALQAALERTLKLLLTETAALSRAVPSFFCPSAERDAAWQQAVDACGRTVTVAAEGIVFRKEAEESGIMNIMPVHRVSLEDTEEEKARRRLDEIDRQLQEELEKRETIMKSIGGCLASLARADCMRRCTDALRQAADRQQELEQGATDGLAIAAQARRIRLLEAAVDWCREDLKDIPFSAQAAPPASVHDAGPRLLSPSAETLFSSLLSESGELDEGKQKSLRELLPDLFSGMPFSDARTLLRDLSAAIRQESALPPLQALVSGAFSVCLAESSAARYLSAGALPAIPLLPDLYAGEPLVTLRTLLSLFGAPEETDSSALRGLLAFLILRIYRRSTAEEAWLLSTACHPEEAPLLHCWLNSRGAKEVRIFSLQREEVRLPVALVLPGHALRPVKWTRSLTELLPSFVTWFNRESAQFLDPIPYLGESDRQLVTKHIAAMVDSMDGSSPSSPLAAFLRAFLSDLRRDSVFPDPSPAFLTRLKAAFGLRLLPAFRQSLRQVITEYERSLTEDPVACALTGQDGFPAISCSLEAETLYVWRDVPFAREHSRLLLEEISVPEEKSVLSMLSAESDLLFSSSDDYRDHLVRELSELLENRPDALPARRRAVLDLLEDAGAPVESPVTELRWPWDTLSPSIRTILSECLGDSLVDPVSMPFSDRLTLFPARGGEIIGDAFFSWMCTVLPLAAPVDGSDASALRTDGVLPPLSPALATVLCGSKEGKTLLHPGFLTFERLESSAIQVAFCLEGNFSLRLVRCYPPEEQITLYAHDLPTLAVWPSVPFSPEDWSSFFLYAHLPASFHVSILDSEGRMEDVFSGEGPRFVSRLSAFPCCFVFHREQETLGALPNLLPTPEIHRDKAVTACVDFGSAGTSVIFSSGRDRYPLHGPTMVRVLLNSSASPELLRREFLPALPVSALLPTVARLFRNVPGVAPSPFEDGIILMPADLDDVLTVPPDSLYPCLKWEQEKGRSGALCLHQLMLMTALQARTDGAQTLSWRFAIPDEMAKEGRERLMNLFQSLAEEVALESGFPRPEKGFPAVFAAESAALGAYFRFCSPEETRGGFMTLDLGACTADIALFLRGREQAVQACQLPLGIHYMLLPELLHQPDLFARELGFVEDSALQGDLAHLTDLFRAAATDTVSLRHSRLALDLFLADRAPTLLPFLLQHPATGMPTRLGSLLLLHFSYLMMLPALMLLNLSGDSSRNDFLPDRMCLCLAGRGASLLEIMPDPVKAGFWRFLTMFRNSRVTSLSLLFSAEKKMEIPVGLSVLQDLSQALPPPSSIPGAIAIRPEELLPEFLLRFRQVFPPCSDQLFPGFFTDDPWHPFSPAGESLVSAAITQAFVGRNMQKPYDALASWISLLLESVRETAQQGDQGGGAWNP